MRTYNLLFIIFLIINLTANGQGSIWPPNAKKKKLDSTLVITHLSEDQIKTFIPLVRSDLIKHEPQFKDAEIGKSVNSATGNVGGNLVKYSFTKDEINTKTIGHTDYDFQTVTDIYDLVKKFNLDVSLSIKYFSFNGNARYEMSKSLKINNYHQYIAARINVIDREESLKEIWIRPEAATLAKNNKELFISKYGDEVITSKVIGGDLIVVIEVESNSKEENQSSKLHVDAAVKAWGASVKTSVDLQNSLTEISKSSSYKLKIIQNGVFLDSTKYTDIASLKELMNNFPQTVHKFGRVLEYKYSSIFQSVQDLPTNITQSDFLLINKQKFQLETIDNNIKAVLATLPDLQYVRDNPQYFTKGSYDTANDLYNLHYQAYRVYEYNYSVCATTPDLCERCLIFKFQPHEFTPTVDLSSVPREQELPLVISPDFKSIIIIPENKTASISFNGKVRYNHIKPLDCRIPALNLTDFSLRDLEDPGGGGVRRRTKLMPLIQLQYFTNTDQPYSDPFYFNGNQINTISVDKTLILKARIDLVWVVVNDDDPNNLKVEVSPRPVEDKIYHINNHIKGCGEFNGITIKINQ